MEFERLLIDPRFVRPSLLIISAAGSRQSFRQVHLEAQRKVRHQIANGDAMRLANQIEAKRRALRPDRPTSNR